MNQALAALREATKSSPYDGRLYLVGGIVRDKLLGRAADEDIDIVLEGDAAALAAFLDASGITEHEPVTYPRFGTAMISIAGRQVEIVGARKESYDRDSRKPSTRPGTLLDDVARRDFTINTLMENLHTGELLDLTGTAERDLKTGIIRTPQDPRLTFDDDPLRMMRAVRFSVTLGFEIAPETFAALGEMSSRLAIVSAERIQSEFVKILMSDHPERGLELLRETGLLAQFAPELAAMHGVTQNIYHIYDVWTHTLRTVESIDQQEGIILRMAALLHDAGKVQTRSVDEEGSVHFYQHQSVSAELARKMLSRLKFPNAIIDKVAFLISMHLRVGEYDEQWTDSAVRRLMREAGDDLEALVKLTEADKAAANPAMPSVDIEVFRAHVARMHAQLAGQHIRSPLGGREIMELLETEEGPAVGRAKAYLEEEIINGNLLPGDKIGASKLLLGRYKDSDSR